MKLKYGAKCCEFSVANNFAILSRVPCEYDRETICYAVQRLFHKSERLCRSCTLESWQLRLAKGNARKRHPFAYVIPAALMELPGAWIRLSGMIDAGGVTVYKIEILTHYPSF